MHVPFVILLGLRSTIMATAVWAILNTQVLPMIRNTQVNLGFFFFLILCLVIRSTFDQNINSIDFMI